MLSGSAFCWRRIRAGEDRERGQERRRLCPHGPGHAAARWRPVEDLGAPLGSREIGAPRLYTPAWSVETGAIELFRGDGALGLVRTLVPPRAHHPKVGSLSRRWCRRTAPMRGAGRTRRRGQGDRRLRLVLRALRTAVLGARGGGGGDEGVRALVTRSCGLRRAVRCVGRAAMPTCPMHSFGDGPVRCWSRRSCPAGC